MKSLPPNLYDDDMIEKVENQIAEWRGKLDAICEHLKSDSKPEFHEVQDFVMDRLSSFACSKHQGYVMNGFELDREMASYLFLEPAEDDFEFNEATKPDYVIIMNRVIDQDELCMELEEKMLMDDDESDVKSEMKRKIKEYK